MNVIQMFPFLANYIASSANEDAASMRTAIDQGLSPVDAISRTYGISKGIVRSVAFRSAAELGLEHDKCDPASRSKPCPAEGGAFDFVPGKMFGALVMVPARWRPVSPAQWRLFQFAADRWAEDLGKIRGGSVWGLYIGRKVLRGLARMRWPATIDIGAGDIDVDTESALDDLIQFLTAAARALQLFVGIDAPLGSCKEFNPFHGIGDFALRQRLRSLLVMGLRWRCLYAVAIESAGKAQGEPSTGEESMALLQKEAGRTAANEILRKHLPRMVQNTS